MGNFIMCLIIFRYKLYQFLITDGLGYGRPVFYGLLRDEKFSSLKKLFSIFREVMGEEYKIRTFVMDRMLAQMSAAKYVYGSDIVLCYFHVKKAINRHVCFCDQ